METRTNIVLHDELVAKAGVSTKKATVDTALRAYVREPDWQGLLALAGSGVLADDDDPAALFDRARAQPMVSEPLVACKAKRRMPIKPSGHDTQRGTRPAPAPRRK